MNNQLMAQTTNSQVAANIEEFRVNCQNFLTKINQLPSEESTDKTPDGKASTILISHIEMLLDEYFFGLWETENFKWAVITNEIVGSIDLCFYHPTAGIRMKRTGAAAIQIMVDRVPDELKNNPTQKNQWALNPDNKKSNALDMSFPKLKAECLKNAANSLGKMFGRDLNRKKSDTYQPIIKETAEQKENKRILKFIENATTVEQLDGIFSNLKNGQITAYQERRAQLVTK